MIWSPSSRTERRLIKPILFIACLLPFVSLVVRLVQSNLGFNPVEILTHETGQWSLRFLLITLAISPVKELTGMKWLIRLRRMIGLYSFFYVVLHFSVYFIWDQGLSISYVIEDIIQRPYITVGFVSLLLMIPLAITSANKIRQKLAKYWTQIHYLTYPAALFAILHFLWLTKADYLEPGIYTAIFGVLMAFRVKNWLTPKKLSNK